MPIRPKLRRTAREAVAEDYLDVASRRPGGDPVGRAPPVRGTPLVTGFLANGRVVPLSVREPLAPLGDLDQLVGTLRRMGDDADAAIRARSQAIVRLSRTVGSDAAQLGRESGAARRKLERQALAASARLDRRIDKELIPLREDIAKAGARHERLVRRLARRALWDDLVVLSALPLFAAFGQRDNPLHSSNLALTLSLLVWLLGDDLTDLISGAETVFGIRDTDIWSYIAPLANVLTGWFLLRNAQNERFITGFASDFRLVFVTADALLSAKAGVGKPAGGTADTGLSERLFKFRQQIDLSLFVAPDHFDAFLGFEHIPAVASIAQITWGPGLDDPAARRIVGLTAVAEDGVLTITITITVAVSYLKQLPRPEAVLSALRAAWIVDTAQPKA
ncbi:MAG TPA: hypothetical protein VF516_07670 [Kofleriaceae bacterium]